MLLRVRMDLVWVLEAALFLKPHQNTVLNEWPLIPFSQYRFAYWTQQPFDSPVHVMSIPFQRHWASVSIKYRVI